MQINLSLYIKELRAPGGEITQLNQWVIPVWRLYAQIISLACLPRHLACISYPLVQVMHF